MPEAPAPSVTICRSVPSKKMDESWPAPKITEPSALKAPSTFKTHLELPTRSVSFRSKLYESEAITKLASNDGVLVKAPKPMELEATLPVSSVSQVKVPVELVVKT